MVASVLSVLGQSASASPTAAGADGSAFPTGAGLIVLAVLIGGLLLMRSRLLRR